MFSSGEDLFELPHSVVGRDWRDGLRSAKALVESYLETGKQAPRLKASQAVGIGFVGGDLELVHMRSTEQMRELLDSLIAGTRDESGRL